VVAAQRIKEDQTFFTFYASAPQNATPSLFQKNMSLSSASSASLQPILLQNPKLLYVPTVTVRGGVTSQKWAVRAR
jgi:hypothetical protein